MTFSQPPIPSLQCTLLTHLQPPLSILTISQPSGLLLPPISCVPFIPIDCPLPLPIGKGDLIGADIPELGQEPWPGAGPSCVLKTSADVKALTYCGLQQLSSRGLAEVLRLYPEYGAAFRAGLPRDLTFNLRQGSENNVCRHCMTASYPPRDLPSK